MGTKTIISCGDSFMTPVHGPTYEGTHFTEIVAKSLGANLIAFARSGMSNGGICLQIEVAINAKPDLIIIGTTGSDRIEFKLRDGDENRLPLQSFFYYSYDGLGGFKLPKDQIPHYKWHKNSSPTLAAEPIVTFLDYPGSDIKPAYESMPDIAEKNSAIQEWFKQLYHPAWKRKLDLWGYSAVISKLQQSGIPYIIACEWLAIDYPTIPEANTLSKKFKPYMEKCPGYDPGYHTPVDVQKQLASMMLEHISQHKIFNLT